MTANDHLPETDEKVGLPDYCLWLDDQERCWEVGTTAGGVRARRRRAEFDPTPGLRNALSVLGDPTEDPHTKRIVECASRVRCSRYTTDCDFRGDRPCSDAGPIHSGFCNYQNPMGCECQAGRPPPLSMTAEEYASAQKARYAEIRQRRYRTRPPTGDQP